MEKQLGQQESQVVLMAIQSGERGGKEFNPLNFWLYLVMHCGSSILVDPTKLQDSIFQLQAAPVNIFGSSLDSCFGYTLNAYQL